MFWSITSDWKEIEESSIIYIYLKKGTYTFSKQLLNNITSVAADDDIQAFPNKQMKNDSTEELRMEQSKSFWHNNGVNALKERLNKKLNISKYLHM